MTWCQGIMRCVSDTKCNCAKASHRVTIHFDWPSRRSFYNWTRIVVCTCCWMLPKRMGLPVLLKLLCGARAWEIRWCRCMITHWLEMNESSTMLRRFREWVVRLKHLLSPSHWIENYRDWRLLTDWLSRRSFCARWSRTLAKQRHCGDSWLARLVETKHLAVLPNDEYYFYIPER